MAVRVSKVTKSPLAGKKTRVHFSDGTHLDRGDSSMSDYRSHKNKKRRKKYYSRHKKNLQGNSKAAMANRAHARRTWDKGGELPPSGIRIKPGNKGKFTAKAKRAGLGVQEFAKRVLSAPEGRYDPSTRKQANFARNAKTKFNKAGGGTIRNSTSKQEADLPSLNRSGKYGRGGKVRNKKIQELPSQSRYKTQTDRVVKGEVILQTGGPVLEDFSRYTGGQRGGGRLPERQVTRQAPSSTSAATDRRARRWNDVPENRKRFPEAVRRGDATVDVIDPKTGKTLTLAAKRRDTGGPINQTNMATRVPRGYSKTPRYVRSMDRKLARGGEPGKGRFYDPPDYTRSTNRARMERPALLRSALQNPNLTEEDRRAMREELRQAEMDRVDTARSYGMIPYMPELPSAGHGMHMARKGHYNTSNPQGINPDNYTEYRYRDYQPGGHDDAYYGSHLTGKMKHMGTYTPHSHPAPRTRVMPDSYDLKAYGGYTMQNGGVTDPPVDPPTDPPVDPVADVTAQVDPRSAAMHDENRPLVIRETDVDALSGGKPRNYLGIAKQAILDEGGFYENGRLMASEETVRRALGRLQPAEGDDPEAYRRTGSNFGRVIQQRSDRASYQANPRLQRAGGGMLYPSGMMRYGGQMGMGGMQLGKGNTRDANFSVSAKGPMMESGGMIIKIAPNLG